MDWRQVCPQGGWQRSAGDGRLHRLRDCGLLLLEAGASMTAPVGTTNMIGYAAATMTTISFLPQLIRVVRLRSARDISLIMFLVFSCGTFAWMVYGFLSHSRPVLIANIVTFLLSMSILILKLRFDRHEVPKTIVEEVSQ
jgi:MtN3 and saliva related transmembrane protein